MIIPSERPRPRFAVRSSPAPPPGRARSEGSALALVTADHALGSFSMLSVAPLPPVLMESLHLSRAPVGLFLSAAYLGGVLMALPPGGLPTVSRLGVSGVVR